MQLVSGGWTKEQAEYWFESKWKKFAEFGEKARKLKPSVQKIAP
jgi:hypothetical protein